MKDLRKTECFFRIAFDEIAVKIQVLRIPPRSEFFRPILVYTIFITSIKTTPYVIHGNKCDHNIRRKLVTIDCNISCEKHTRINAIRLPRMDTIVKKNDSLIFLPDRRKVEVPVP